MAATETKKARLARGRRGGPQRKRGEGLRKPKGGGGLFLELARGRALNVPALRFEAWDAGAAKVERNIPPKGRKKFFSSSAVGPRGAKSGEMHEPMLSEKRRSLSKKSQTLFRKIVSSL